MLGILRLLAPCRCRRVSVLDLRYMKEIHQIESIDESRWLTCERGADQSRTAGEMHQLGVAHFVQGTVGNVNPKRAERAGLKGVQDFVVAHRLLQVRRLCTLIVPRATRRGTPNRSPARRRPGQQTDVEPRMDCRTPRPSAPQPAGLSQGRSAAIPCWGASTCIHGCSGEQSTRRLAPARCRGHFSRGISRR